MLVLLPLMAATSPDGGDAPTVAPQLTGPLAPILAPELAPGAGVAPVRPTLSVYRVNFLAELTLTASSVAVVAIIDVLVKPTLEGDVSCRREVGNGRCNPADLSAFDRYAVGRRSKEWTIMSDIALYASVVIPTLYLGLESLALPTVDPWGDWAGDLLVVSEAMALTAVAQTFMKFAFLRPRPVRYQDVDVPLSTFDHELSFPSGHTSMVAAATTALTTTVFFRHPESKVRFVVLGGGVLLTGLTGLARVESGHHFPSDVLTGMLLGGLAGFVVPWLHRNHLPITPTASFNLAGESRFGLAGTF